MTARRAVRSTWPAVALAAALVLAAGAPGIAQTELYIIAKNAAGIVCVSPSCPPGRLIQIDLERGAIIDDRPVHHTGAVVTRPRVTPDGRYVAWFGSEGGSSTAWPPSALNLFELSTGVQTVSFAAESPGGGTFTLHPSIMRGFFQLALYGPVVVAEPGATRVLPAPCSHPLFSGRSGDGRRLSFSCGADAVVTDSDSGQVTAHLKEVWGSHTLNVGGTELLAAYWDWDGFYPPEYQRRDVATGAMLAHRVAPYDEYGGGLWGVNWLAGQVYVSGSTGITVLDLTTLQPIGLIPRFGNRYPAHGVLDAERSLLYLAWPAPSADQRTVLTGVDTRTLATIGTMEIAVGRHELVGMALGPRPPRVSALSILVENHLATLTWTVDASRSMATEQVVEVGFAPGETVARLAVAADTTSVTVPGVPPGRYYVRIRSINGTGIGAPSNEVLVEVL